MWRISIKWCKKKKKKKLGEIKRGEKRDKEYLILSKCRAGEEEKRSFPPPSAGAGFRSREFILPVLDFQKVHLSESRIRAKPRDIFSITRLTVVIYIMKKRRRSRALRLTDEE